MRNLIAVALLLGTVCPRLLQADDWPSFRGPNGKGITNDTGFPTKWGPGENIKWKVALPGDGNSSPIVSNGYVFVASADNQGANRILSCYDRSNGELQWSKVVQYKGGEQTHKTNPYSGSTPVSDGKRVIVWHGSAGLFCYDFSGKSLWKQTELGSASHMWGYGSSPIIYKDRVIINFGPGKNTFMVALGLENGKVIWKTKEPGGSDDGSGRMVGSWSTPAIIKVDGQDQILCSMPTRVVAYDPENGKIMWSVGGLPSPRGDLVYTSVVLGDDYGIAMGGYKGPAIGFHFGGEGDVTAQNRFWHQRDRQPQRIGSGVIVGDYLYIGNAGPNTIECIHAKTGKQMWQERAAGAHWGSVVLAEGKIYANSQDGSTTIFLPNPKKFELISVNNLNERTNSTPAFSDGEIFQRTEKHLYCIGG